MSWPPSPSAAFTTTDTTIQWGTDGILAGYIVKSMRFMDTQEVIYIENGTGLRAVRIQLWQGREVEITIVADSTFVNPAPETALTLIDPISDTSMTFKTTANAFSGARKQEGERSISAVFTTLIEGGGSPPPQHG